MNVACQLCWHRDVTQRYHPLVALSYTYCETSLMSVSDSLGPKAHLPLGVQPSPNPYILPLPLYVSW